ncbi:MAG: serine/threonine-protein kinase [Kofleriaceae bacterium]
MNSGDLVAGRFRIDQRVGAGGMGVVYRARDEAEDRWVAVKVFSWRNAIEVERAHREVHVLAQLDHPAIVSHVADGVTPDGQLWLAMEWVDGITIAERLDHDGLSIREAVAMIRPICEGLAVAHAAGFLHRDIKPSNVMFAAGDPAAARLIDFGVARVLDAVKSLTRTGTAIGTPGYMSPEQARGERELTSAADVFGLGCLLYECVTGRPAFSGTLAAAVMAKILLSDPPPVTALCPEAPAALVALIDRMLKKQLVRRLPDIEAVLAALDALGAMPEGPRRSSHALAVATFVPDLPTQRDLHCIVGAARGSLDDMLEPPGDAVHEQLARIARDHDAALETFVSGAVVAHLAGEPKPTVIRAAMLALAMREVLVGWTIVISSADSDLAAAVDTGTQLLNGDAIAAIFRKRSAVPVAIGVDAYTAELLRGEPDFDVVVGETPRLVGRKQRA